MWLAFDWRAAVVSRQHHPGLRQTRIRQRIIRILCDRLIEIIDRLPEIRSAPFAPEVSALKIKFVRRWIFCRLFRDGVFFRDLGLDCEDVSKLPIERIRPEMRVS